MDSRYLSVKNDPHFMRIKIFSKNLYNVTGVVRYRENPATPFRLCVQPITLKKSKQLGTKKTVKGSIQKAAVCPVHIYESW
ncbi:MAG: hypothetical protein BWY90_00106 [Deltaproteobacteria bacterium ADurb.BinA014]|nr:MAG: hypothetical protein BWY90_00106 [Deltaproteobacteria bacterium ADurb.BinA014]